MEICDTGSTSSCFPGRPYLRQPYDLSPAAAAAAAVVASVNTVSTTLPNTGLRFTYSGYPIPNPQYATQYQTLTTNNSIYVADNHCHKDYFIDSSARKSSVQYETQQGVEGNQLSYGVRSLQDAYNYPQYTTHYNTKALVYPVSTSPKNAVCNVTASTDTKHSDAVRSTESVNEVARSFYLPWSQSRPVPESTPVTNSLKNISVEHSSNGARKTTEFARFGSTTGQSSSAVGTDILLHNASSLSQWDVNDPKLPKIRQFDTFTMWPQGHCRFAYQKSASEGARRHASGWAMRNTNNHNAQILKKSCLGVLLCTAENCSLTMRPAICDKARRRQEGRPCCMPNCGGRIYNQPCRGHGGYPVTHFWREHGDTVYFQSKGTHDHRRPDLKPVRDTAARRRRQMQLEKLQQTRTLTTPNENNVRQSDCFSVRGNSKLREVGRVAGMIRKRAAEHMECKTEEVPVLGKAPLAETNWTSSMDHIKMARTTLVTDRHQPPASSVCLKPEPIFPSSPALGSYSLVNHTDQDNALCMVPPKLGSISSRDNNTTFESSIPLTTTYSATHYSASGMYSASGTNPHLFDSRVEVRTSQTENNLNPTVFGSSFMKDLLYEDELRKLEGKSFYAGYTDPQIQLGKKPATQNILQLSQHQMSQQQTTLAGPNSESTSGGLNASWSTPSPPTGGSSSLFGSNELRNAMTAPAGVDDSESKDKINTNAQTWRVDTSCPQTSVPVPAHVTSPSPLPLSGYGLSTPTHAIYGIQPLSALESPDNLMGRSSILMSSSTPLSNDSLVTSRFAHQWAQSGAAYPTGYITPIPFYSNGSDSRSTRASSSSGETTSQESGPVV
ncbi:Transcription factor glial cells missing [Fasciola gigantica]|uniref:Transcription factor glial cells missing n=1 Tax=Fasciola gigantica TaxID=46835 RepID=A0A504WV56_FASGI|nr:Transcription factor glial cells missing [Fasciola gigantica]